MMPKPSPSVLMPSKRVTTLVCVLINDDFTHLTNHSRIEADRESDALYAVIARRVCRIATALAGVVSGAVGGGQVKVVGVGVDP